VPNSNRVGTILREPNFGLIEIDWRSRKPTLHLQARDARGAVRISKQVLLDELRG
jgi:hypothetical protein